MSKDLSNGTIRGLRFCTDMTSFKCNQKGCCCRGWDLFFDADEAIALVNCAPASDRQDLLDGARVMEVEVAGRKRQLMQLTAFEADRQCYFLDAAGATCRVHAQGGAHRLPHLCRQFPTLSWDLGSGPLEVYHDATCPEVMNVLAATDGPYGVTPPDVEPGADLADRASRPLRPRHLQVGGHRISHAEALSMRDALVSAANARRVPPMALVCEFAHALADCARGEAFDLMSPLRPRDRVAFDAYFERCVATHAARPLFRLALGYRRFVHEGALFPDRWGDLESHLGYAPDWSSRVDPHRPDLQGLVYRFMAHRFFSVFSSARTFDRHGLAYGSLVPTLGTAFRMADALCRWLQRPLCRTLLKVSLGFSEYVYRMLAIPPDAMVWFGPRPVDLSGDSA